MSLIIDAFTYAATKHRDQKRKYSGAPYIVHPFAVARTVEAFGYRAEVVAAALLHDVVEDTDATLKDVIDRFGRDVASLVAMVTDVSLPSDGNRAVRKAIDRVHLAQASDEGKAIKLADTIDNTHDIVANDPKFAATYLAEKRLLLPHLTGANEELYRIAHRAVFGETP